MNNPEYTDMTNFYNTIKADGYSRELQDQLYDQLLIMPYMDRRGLAEAYRPEDSSIPAIHEMLEFLSNDPDLVIVSTMIWKGGEPYIENNSTELVRKTLGEYYSRELKIAVDVVIDLMRRFAFERLSLKRAEDSLQFELSKVRNMIGLPLSEEIKKVFTTKGECAWTMLLGNKWIEDQLSGRDLIAMAFTDAMMMSYEDNVTERKTFTTCPNKEIVNAINNIGYQQLKKDFNITLNKLMRDPRSRSRFYMCSQ